MQHLPATTTARIQPRIIIIEDVHDLREDIREILVMEGYQVDTASDGIMGLASIRKDTPDLILCDIMMPNLDGYAVLSAVREDVRTANIPFVFMSARTERGDVRQGMVAGADDYLTKPFLVNELLDCVQSQLQKSWQSDLRLERRLDELRNSIALALPHEFRTPLTTIMNYSDMLITEAESITPDEILQWGGHVHTAARQLNRIVNNYLYYVRLEVASEHEFFEDWGDARVFNAHEILEYQTRAIARDYQRSDDLTCSFDEVNALSISEQHLYKIIEEIVSNAMKFSHPGDQINVVGNGIDDRYVLIIQDSGRGMSEEQSSLLGTYMQFERWLYEQQGTGLGLAIAQRLVQLYQGGFNIVSSAGVGTTVTISLQVGSQQ